MRPQSQLPVRGPNFANTPRSAANSIDDAMVPTYLTPSDFSLKQLLALATAHVKVSIAIFVVIVAIVGGVLKVLPKTYVATATLMVNLEGRDPLAAQDVPTNMLGSYVATQTELIRSPAILSAVVDKLGLAQDPEYVEGYRGTDAQGLQEYAEKSLSGTLAVDQGRGGQLIYVSAYGKDPEKAARVANTVSAVYLEEQSRRTLDPARAQEALYTEGLAELRAKMDAAQEKLAEYRRKNKLANTTASDNDAEAQTLAAYETQLLEARRARQELEAKSIGQGLASTEVLSSAIIQGLRTQLSDLEVQYAQLSTTYGPNHPKLKELQSQIATLNREISGETSTVTNNVSTELARARQLEAQYAQAVERQRERLLQLRQIQDEGIKLNVELASAEAVYKQALDGYDRVKFAATGNNNRVTSVSEAKPPVTAVRPAKLKLMAMGCMAALFFAIGLPFLYELFIDRRVRCRDDLEREFHLPVLAELPACPALAEARAS